ncbi:MAG TPA: pyridoxamine 5'-phosphate oxidase family protein [Candidatus Sulfotelmatobacter sp.]|nr:pyridoxamine 5'-phosphate oxidase family protein [Candidatus Sulfotelmatobacter sp.]
MLIREMTPQECRAFVERVGFGRLGAARDNQPYVVPFYFAYESGRLYSFTTLGKKIRWMRANPKVCVEVDEVKNHFEWMSVILTGRFQELPNTLEYALERQQALEALEKRSLWWQTAFASGQVSGRHTAEPIIYCVHIDTVTGHRAVPDAVESSIALAERAKAS